MSLNLKQYCEMDYRSEGLISVQGHLIGHFTSNQGGQIMVHLARHLAGYLSGQLKGHLAGYLVSPF